MTTAIKDLEQRGLEARCEAQEKCIMRQRVIIANLERDLARKQLYIERLERKIPRTKITARQKAEQAFHGKDKAIRSAAS